MNEKGQVILALILAMTVALAIGISIIQKSLTDVSTATKVEESGRAFSAAEAALEKALKGDPTGVNFVEENSSQAVLESTDLGLIPKVPVINSRQDPLQFYHPALSKEEVVQVWLANYTDTISPPSAAYNQQTLDVYWGNDATTDKAALELTLIYYDAARYSSKKWYLDHPFTRTPPNNFEQVADCGGYTLATNTYQCKKTINLYTDPEPDIPSGATLMLLRARLLYNSASQPFAVQAVGTRGVGSCASGGCWLPPQAQDITSKGTSGDTQRKVRVQRLFNVVPPYFDYAIFSTGEITK